MKVAIFTFSLFGINTYVVYDPGTKECAIIDPGMLGKEEENAMDGFISRNCLKVVAVINTHLHIDHVVGDHFSASRYGVPVKAHKADEPLGERVQEQAAMFGIREKFHGVEITEYLEEGDVIKIGEGELKVIHVPGHSQGSIALYDEKDGFLIAGDILFQGSVGRTDLPGGSHEQLINGIKRKLMVLPEETKVYPGHGPSTTIGDEKRYNPFLG
ncbi:MAG: MBL fold metallo-hydrolase [Bacteroidales bacterium]|nr:MBL fold metallo-hydrolase [Bacteroidales bacterium]